MKKSVIVVAALATIGLCAPVFAEDAKTGPVALTDVELDQVVAGDGSSLVGAIVSSSVEGWYGNTTNPRPGGKGVTPTLAPGPWKCANPADCFQGATAGGSVGEFIAPFTSGGNATPDFANGTTTVKDNFGQPYDHGGVGP